MYSFIENISVRNFKSLRVCDIEGCKRINLFIGRPNVGKSNIIEALSLFSIPFLKESGSRKLTDLIRLESETELFYNGDWEQESAISTNLGSCNIQYNPKQGLVVSLHDGSSSYAVRVDEQLKVKSLYANAPNTAIKRYNFKTDVKYRKGHAKYLLPPFGTNLLSVIEKYEQLKAQVTDMFRAYNLEIAFDKGSQTIKILQKTKDGIFLVPYNSVADTLQRIIFFKTAITSNNNSVLLFEEPEAHSFPPYMTHLTQEMIYKKDNQFFIATHSPFIMNDLLENAQDELAIFNVNYQDRQTIVKKLSREELHNVFQNGVDLFTNNEAYL